MMIGRYRAYSEYKNSSVNMLGALPVNWTTKQVRFLLKDGSDGIKIGPFGSALKLDDMADSGVRVYGQENVIQRDFSLGQRRISQTKYKEMRVYEVYPNDLLITMMGTSGKCAIVPDDAEIGIIDSHLLRMRVNESEILPRFFRLLIDECHEIENQIKASGKGSIMHGLNSSIVKSLQLPLPSKTEQETILHFLDYETAKIDTLIEKQQQFIKLLKEKRQAVISHAVTKGLNPNASMRDSGIEWLGEVPAHWIVGRYKFCTTRVVVGIAEAATHAYADTGIPIIRSTNIREEGLDTSGMLFIKEEFAEKNDSKYLYANDVITVRTGYPGISAVIPQDLDRSQCFTNLVASPRKSMVPEFLAEYLNSHTGKSYFDLLGWGSAQKNISVSILQNVPIAYPNEDEQTMIVKFVKEQRNRYTHLVEKANLQIQLLQERRTALVSAAVTGKIDVRNWQAPSQTTIQKIAA